ncbi:MAG: hypothetical protein HY784_06225 [Chloroflexi bacterium]|nr:hypothetical protein [Chloroflexota bacterium]
MGQSTITLAGDGLQAAQAWKIEIAVEATVNVDAKSARRKATGWLLDTVGNMVVGGAPRLVIGRQTVWRVPAVLTSTYRGVVREIGAVDVDAESGEILGAEALAALLLKNAQNTARPTPPPIRI